MNQQKIQVQHWLQHCAGFLFMTGKNKMVLLHKKHQSLHWPLLWFAWRLLRLQKSNGSVILLQLPGGGWSPHHLANLFNWWQPPSLTQHIYSIQEKGIFAPLGIHFPLLVVRDHWWDRIFIASACVMQRESSMIWFCAVLSCCHCWSGCSCLLWV